MDSSLGGWGKIREEEESEGLGTNISYCACNFVYITSYHSYYTQYIKYYILKESNFYETLTFHKIKYLKNLLIIYLLKTTFENQSPA